MESLEKACSTINEIYKDKDPKKLAAPRIAFLYFIIKTLKDIGATNNMIKAADPALLKPACNPELLEIPLGFNHRQRFAILNETACNLCKHIPYRLTRCEKCRRHYCHMCVLFLARIYEASQHQTDLSKCHANSLKFACVEKSCSNGQIVMSFQSQPHQYLFDLLNKCVYTCNRSKCQFKGSRVTFDKHWNDCSEFDAKININILPTHIGLMLIGSKSIWELIEQSNERCESVMRREDDKTEEEEIDWEFPEPEIEIEGDLKDKEKIPFGAIEEQSIDWSSVEQPTEGLCPYNQQPKRQTVIPGNFLPITVFPKKPKPTSKFAVDPEPEGYMDLDGVKVTLVTAAQIIGKDRAIPKVSKEEYLARRKEYISNIDDPKKLRNKLTKIKQRTFEHLHKKQNQLERKRQNTRYAEALKQIEPPMRLPDHEKCFASANAYDNIAHCIKNGITVVSLDIEGQTIKLNEIRYAVPGSVGMCGLSGDIVVHEIVRWGKELLFEPEKPNQMTGLSYELAKYGSTLAHVRFRVAKALLEADRIILHGQGSDLKGLYFKKEDYELIRHKIRDIGAYYNVHTSENGSMALQLGTFLLFQKAIQQKYHYAIEDAYWTLMLYYADMNAIEKCYEQIKLNSTYDKDGWPYIRYPANRQMAGLWIRFANKFRKWPNCIAKRHYGRWRPAPTSENVIEPDERIHSPYCVMPQSFERFFTRRLPMNRDKRDSSKVGDM